MTDSAPVVSLRDVSVRVPSGDGTTTILDNVSVDIWPGEVVAVCGLSGAGKSTLLRVIAGLQPVSTGQVLHQGRSIRGVPDGIGYVVQDYSQSLFPWFSVARNLLLALRNESASRKEKKATVSQALADVGLAGHEKSQLWQLSGGMQQRVAIARALIGNKTVLLMDEPFASVDAQVRQELEDLTLSVSAKKNIATIVVTHDIDEAVYMADRVIVIGEKPGTVSANIDVTLPRPRNQLETREHSSFSIHRREVSESMWPESRREPSTDAKP